MLASVTDFKTPEVMIWKYFDGGGEKKVGFVGCVFLGGWVVYCSITGKCFMNKLECLRKKIV